jgi:hypothetical protein
MPDLYLTIVSGIEVRGTLDTNHGNSISRCVMYANEFVDSSTI